MLIRLPVRGFFEVNTYLYCDDQTKHGFLIDPGAEPQRILSVIQDNNLVIEQILLTHGHFDHTGAANSLHQILNVPIRLSIAGRRYAEDPFWNLSSACGQNIVLPDVDYFDTDQLSSLTVDNCHLQIIPVPGHTPDSVLFYSEQDQLAFVGDTIFLGSMGTAQFYGGNEQQLVTSIVEKVICLPDNTILYSGHSLPTTVANEKQQPYLQALRYNFYSKA